MQLIATRSPEVLQKQNNRQKEQQKTEQKKLTLIHVNILCNILILFCTKSDNEVEVQSRA